MRLTVSSRSETIINFTVSVWWWKKYNDTAPRIPADLPTLGFASLVQVQTWWAGQRTPQYYCENSFNLVDVASLTPPGIQGPRFTNHCSNIGASFFFYRILTGKKKKNYLSGMGAPGWLIASDSWFQLWAQWGDSLRFFLILCPSPYLCSLTLSLSQIRK